MGRYVRTIFLIWLSVCYGLFTSAQENSAEIEQLEAAKKLIDKDPEKAIAVATRVRAIGDPVLTAESDRILMQAYGQTGNIDTAVYFGEEAIRLARELGSVKKEASYTEKLARLHRNVGESEKAVELYTMAIGLFESLEDSFRLAYVENSIGIAFKKMGQYEEALDHYARSLSIRKALKDKNRIAQTINNIGNVYRLQGTLDSALSKYMSALVVFEELNDSTNMTNSLNNIGLIHKTNGDSEKALKYYNRVLKIRTLLNDQRGLQAIRNNIAIIYRERNMRDSALYYFNQNYDYAWSHGIKDAEALALHNAASIYMDDGQWQNAVNGFRQAFDIREQLKDRYGAASSSQNLAETYFRMGQPQKGIPHAEYALSLSEEIGSKRQTADIYNLLHKSLSQVGNYEQAYFYHNLEKALRDSLFKEDQDKTIQVLEANYEKEKKAQELLLSERENALKEEKIRRQKTTRNYLYLVIGIGLVVLFILFIQAKSLRAANQKLTGQKDELARNAEEKELLLNEIHHRVKNNLQVVSSLLNMQSREVTDEKVLSALKEGRDRVHSMALVHQMFYQGADESSSIQADNYIEQLCGSLLRSYGADDSVELQLSIQPTKFDIDRAILVGLIINELVSNSLKYAFKGKTEKGKLTVSLNSEGEDHILVVQDNGSGQTTDNRNADSFGLKLVNSTIKKLNGRVTVITDNGYSTRIEFPKLNENVLSKSQNTNS